LFIKIIINIHKKKRKHSFTLSDGCNHSQQSDQQIENLKQTVENLQQQNNILLVKLDKLINSMNSINNLNIMYTKSLNVSVSTQTDEIFYNYDYYA
jgi:hypothetical protein